MHSSSDVTFVERDGTDAETTLARLQARLERAGTASRLLRSRDRADLRLLVVDGATHLTADDVRGARVWRFADTDADADPIDPGGDPRSPDGGTTR